MIFLKLAAVTCAFYPGIALLMDVASFSLAHLMGGFMFFAPRRGWGLLFGVVWLVSFLLAYHILFTPKVSK